jgi:hypothetical protein
MPPVVFSTHSLLELEQFISRALCEQERLDQQQMVVKRSLIRRQQQLVGVVFRVDSWHRRHGHALWIEAENRVLFYNSAGARFAEVSLLDAPQLEPDHLLQAA